MTIQLDERCVQMVSGAGTWGGLHRHRCTRKAIKDGFCKQHHPDTEKARREEADRQQRERMAYEARHRERQAVALLTSLGYTITAPAGRETP